MFSPKARRPATICALVVFSLLTLSFFHFPYGQVAPKPFPNDAFGVESNLIGSPTPRFRDNLRSDRKYITAWTVAGWTNNVMTYINLVYLALITDRIPIIPVFRSSGIHFGDAPPVDFGLVFDVPHLRTALGTPILEWHEVKDRNSEIFDDLGCWNTWEAVQHRKDGHPRKGSVPDLLKLDLSYTKAPSWIKVTPKSDRDVHSSFWSLAALAFPEARAANLAPPSISLHHNVSLPPDEHLTCYDNLYYVCANHPNEYELDYSPAWRFVGQHVRFTPRIEELADSYVRKAIGVEEGHPTPPWIAIHMRHGDFRNSCGKNMTGCFPPIAAIARRVDEVKEEIQWRKGISVNHVIMTSDEKDATWWEDVRARGWLSIDHSQTAETLGIWYPTFIDAAIQSRALGFVGTARSTMSLIARRRVESWNDGATRTVQWGKPNSDDH